jgi:hypothetical protein
MVFVAKDSLIQAKVEIKYKINYIEARITMI